MQFAKSACKSLVLLQIYALRLSRARMNSSGNGHDNSIASPVRG